jgi:hypothetical protein
MDPKAYCARALQAVASEPADVPVRDRAQVRLLLANLARFGPPDEAEFARELAALARQAEQDGRRGLAWAARQILADWTARRTID